MIKKLVLLLSISFLLCACSDESYYEHRNEDLLETGVYVLIEDIDKYINEDYEDVCYHRHSCEVFEEKDRWDISFEITLESALDHRFSPCPDCEPVEYYYY